MVTQQEVIKRLMKSLDTATVSGTAALDEAIKACSTFNSFAELKAAMIRDIRNAKSGDGNDYVATNYRGTKNITVNSGAGNDFFHNDPLSGGADSVKIDGG